MKTIRTKVYQFSELSLLVKKQVIEHYRISLNLPASYPSSKIYTWIEKRKYDFTKDGKLFHS